MSRMAFFFGLCMLTVCLSFAQSRPDSCSFNRITHDFGTIKANKSETAVFKLTNAGVSPLVVLDVKVSCNCVKVEWTRQPILPDESADLVITYKDRNAGAFYKVVEVVTNASPSKHRLILKGTIQK